MTPQARDYIKTHGGKVPDRLIAEHLKCAEITVRKARSDLGITGYRGRPGWDRRQWLLNSAAGLDFEISVQADLDHRPQKGLQDGKAPESTDREIQHFRL